MKKRIRRFMQRKQQQVRIGLLSVAASGLAIYAAAQTADGNAGITQATTTVKGYFDAGCNLMYAIGAILGLVGAIKV